jgi:VIT1/CCC1 family predicted Fe2+/Mn2+ transporter
LVGSVVPIVPFFLLAYGLAPIASVVASALALFALGAYKARATVGRPWVAGIELAAIGLVSAFVGYVAGAAFGAV